MADDGGSVAAFCGVAIIVGDARASSDVLGIALACLMTVAIAAMTVIVRRHKETPMVAAAAWSNVLGSIVSIPFANGIATVSGADLVILAMFGFFQVALGLTLFVLGSRLLPSGQAALIATLETPLMPFWVWLAFQESPAPRALVGGALVMGALSPTSPAITEFANRLATSPRTGTDRAGRTARH
jgi:drug/metabolite transporter (DMT)-like permease